jgi:hypothetical protein
LPIDRAKILRRRPGEFNAQGGHRLPTAL